MPELPSWCRTRSTRRQRAGCSSSPGSFWSRAGHPHEHAQALGKIMDLGIRGKTAIVCAASKGLGKGCAASLAAEGVNLVITARGREALEATAAELRERFGVTVTTVPGDITMQEGRQAALRACASPDILVNNAGGPPPGDFRDCDRETWVKALDANMIAPILMIRAVVDAMMAQSFGRIVNITSGAVKYPIPELGPSNGPRTGLTRF